MQTVPPDHEHVSPGERYHAEVTAAEADVREAMASIRAEEDAGRITTARANAERVDLLERHLARLHALRIRHLGDAP